MFEGYDTSLFWDDDDTAYVQGSHAWRVFPAIQQFQIDLKTGKSLSGPPVTIWNGTGGLVSCLNDSHRFVALNEIALEAPEGPHIYQRNDGYYYLLIAEGMLSSLIVAVQYH